MPGEWKTGIICSLYKKGDPLIYSNYRGILLLNVVYKILSVIIHKTILPFVEKEYQCERISIDELYNLKQKLRKPMNLK